MSFDPPASAPLWLASRSPRRRAMLRAAGVAVRVHPAGIDDGRLARGRVAPAAWVSSLAYLKARWVAEALDAAGEPPGGCVLGADTVCVLDGEILGQPEDDEVARDFLRRLRGARHVTMTGVCVAKRGDPAARWMLVDAASVTWDDVPDGEIDAYVRSGAWRGKAGAYNLEERQAAGWPVSCEGDPATVMGLPMRRLGAWLARMRSAAGEAPS